MMNIDSTYAESDGGGRLLLPFQLLPNTEDTIASHLKLNTIFLKQGQNDAPWTGYYAPWRGAKLAIRMYQGVWFEIRHAKLSNAWYAYRVARPGLNLLHEPNERMNIDVLRAQTAAKDDTTSNAPVPPTSGFATTHITTAPHTPATDSEPAEEPDTSIPGIGANFGEGSKGKGKEKDGSDTTIKGFGDSSGDASGAAPGGGDDDDDAGADDTEDDRKMRTFFKAMRGERLEGSLPAPFTGDRTKTKKFLIAFNRYCYL